MESEIREVKTSHLFDHRDIPAIFFMEKILLDLKRPTNFWKSYLIVLLSYKPNTTSTPNADIWKPKPKCTATSFLVRT